jgi:hypothetical protein
MLKLGNNRCIGKSLERELPTAHKTQDKDKQNNKEIHNTMCVGHHYTQTNTNNVTKKA